MTPFEVVYRRPCRTPSCWLDNKDPIIVCPELIEEIAKQVELIKKRMKDAQNIQKSYLNFKRRLQEFKEGEVVFLKISPVRLVMKFENSSKLRPRYVGLFEILKRMGNVA